MNERAASQEMVAAPVREWLTDRRATLRCILSAHVDDIKGAARRQVAESLLRHLEQHFGPCKAEWGSFMHTGIQHESKPGEVYCHQHKYAESLTLMDTSSLKGQAETEPVDAVLQGGYSSLLGGTAWTVLTRADAAIYIYIYIYTGAPAEVSCASRC